MSLLKARDRLDELYEFAPVGFVTLDRRGTIVAANATAARLLAVERKDLPGLRLSSFVDRTTAQDYIRHRRAVFSSPGKQSCQLRLKPRAGPPVVVRLEGMAYTDPVSKVPQSRTALIDVTDRVRAEEALRENEDRFRSFMDNSATVAWMKDAQGRHVYLSKSYEKRFGVRLADWLGRTDFELWPKKVAEQFRKNDRAVLAGRRTIEVTEETTEADGRRSFWWNFKFPFQDSSGRKYVGGIGIDITERKQLEARLAELNAHLERRVAERTALAERQAAQLRVLARELAQAEQRERNRVAQILHDHLQQLLIAIQYRLELLQTKPIETDWPALLRQSRHLLKEAIASARSLSVELNPPILKTEGLRGALGWLRSWMNEKYGLHLLVQLQPGAEPADPSVRLLVFQVLRELLLNVVKHAHVLRAQVKVHRATNHLTQIVVADRGVGFDAASWRARLPSGQSLGLRSACQRLEIIGGSLNIQSTRGQGTKATILVPSRAQEQSQTRTGRRGDTETRRRGDTETRRRGDTE